MHNDYERVIIMYILINLINCRGKREQRETLDQVDLPGLSVVLEPRVLQAAKALRASQEHKANPGHQETLDHKDPLEPLVWMESLDQ